MLELSTVLQARYMGAHGHGQLAKAVNNCLYDVACAAMAEMLPLAQKAGPRWKWTFDFDLRSQAPDAQLVSWPRA